jgi:HSP20 family protein
MRLQYLSPSVSKRALTTGGYDPFRPFRSQFDRLFEDFFGDYGAPATRGEGEAAAPAISPNLDIAETDKAYEIAVELPGVEEKDLDVSVSEGVLAIKGEKRSESEEKEKNFHRVERSYGSFERRLTLPAEVDAEKIDANFANGVLTVTIPKAEGAKETVRKISIKKS